MRIFDADVTGSLHVSGSSELKGNLVVSGSETITGSLTVQGNAKIGDQISDIHTVTGSLLVTGSINSTLNVTAQSFIKTGGLSTQFLKADGSIDGSVFLTSHPSVSAAASSDNSGRTYIQDILLDSFGHITGITTATETIVETDTLATVTARGSTTTTPVTFNGDVRLGNAADLTFVDLAGTFPTSGKGFDWTLNNDGARIYAIQPSSDSIDFVFELRDNATTNDRFVFHVNDYQGPAFDKYPLIIRGGTEFDLVNSALYINGTLVLSNGRVLQNITGNISMFTNDTGYLTAHPSVSAASSSNNSGRTYIQDILLDSFGHITGITTATETVVDTNNFTTGGTTNSTTGLITFTKNDGGTYTTSISGYVQTQITNLIDSSPATLDTLNELAAALGDDPNFATTVSTAIGNKVSKSGDTMTGNLSIYKNNTTLTLGQINVSTGFTTIEMYAGSGGAFNGYFIRYNKDASFDQLEFIDGGGTPRIFFENGGIINATVLRKIGGLSTQFLKADGTVDTNTYLTVHPSVSAAASSNNSGRTYIQDILLDSFGHITGITTSTETVVDTNTFITGATFNTGDGVVTITKNDGNTVTVDLDGRYQAAGSYLTGFTETDTLSTVTARGNTTNQAITVSGVTSYNDVVISGGTLTVFESVSGATIFAVDGTNGRLFAVTDDLSNSLFSVNTISGLPVIEAFADYHVVMGRFNQNDFHLGTTGEIGMGTVPVSGFKLAVVGNIRATSFVKTGGTSTQFLKADGSVDSSTYLTVHPSVSASASSNNSGRTYIQDILLDGFGHITGITTATETVVDTNNFTTGATFNTGDGVVTFTKNDGTTYNVDLDGRYGTSSTDFFTTGATFNTGNGVITHTRNDGGTYTVDIDGRFLTSYTETDTLDSVAQRGSTTTANLTAATFRTTGGNSGQFVKGDGSLDSNTYLTSYLNNFTTGATFNTSDGVITLTRNDGGTFTVDIDGRFLTSYSETDTLSSVTARGASTSTQSIFTGGLNVRKNQTDNNYTTAALTTESYGNTTTGIAFHISGNVGKFLEMRTDGVLYWDNTKVWTAGTDGATSGLDADLLDGQHGSYYYPASNPSGYISSFLNYFTTGSTFNTSNGVITFTRNDGNTYTVDIDGKYAESAHIHDDRYLPYEKTSDVPKYVGWYTIATNSGNRATGKFILRDTSSGNHQSTVFYATHHFGLHSDITVLINSAYSGSPFRYIRVVDGGTYDGALLQIYVDLDGAQVQAWLLEDIQSAGWIIKDWIPDGTDPGDVPNFSAMVEVPAQVDLDNTPVGGIITTGPIFGGGNTTQYEYLNTNNYSTTTDTRYYTETEIGNFFGGSTAITGYNKSNWDTAFGWGNHGTQGYATTGYVQTQITNLVDGAPGLLDTLNELAAAIGDDANFATTITTSISNKVSKSGDTMTGNLSFGASSGLGIFWGLNTDAAFIRFVSTSNAAGGSYLEIGTQDDSDEEIKFTQSGNVRFYLATDGFLKNVSGYKYVFENGTWGINISGNAATVTNGVYDNVSYSNPSFIATLAGSKITGNIGGNASNITSYTINQDLGTSNSPTFSVVKATRFEASASSTRNKLSLWGTDTNYVIGMESSVTYGGLNDYAMTFQFNNEDDRGFWWGHANHTTAQGAMALTTNGYLTVARGVRVGFGESDVATPNVPLQVYGSGSLVFDVQGSQGQLFSITDSLSGSLFSVNDISGLPILEIFSDDKLVAGSFGTNAFVVSGTTTTVSGSLAVSGSATVNGGTVWHSGNLTNLNQLSNGPGYTTNTGTVTSVSGTGTVSGLSLSGTVTGSGNLTLGGTLSLTSGNVTTALGFTPYNATNPSGFISSITSGNVTTALGFTPYNATNPSGFISSITSDNVTTALGFTPYNSTNPSGFITSSGSISGNASTATILQTARTINGTSFNGSADIAIGRIYDTNFRRITNPGGGEFVTQVESVTGAIEIVFPNAMAYGMYRLVIKVYEYTTNESFEVHAGGHTSGGIWYNEFAYIIGNPTIDRRFTVRFGRNAAGKAVVYIGEIGSTWSYPQVYLTEFTNGYSSFEDNSTGWAINFRTAAFENVSRTIDNCQVGYAVSTNTANSNVLRDGSGNFSAGTITATLSGNASTATTAGALTSMNISQFTNNSGYITGISFANVSSKPTTLSGYGITDALYQNRDTINVDTFNPTGLYRGSTSGWSNRPTIVHNGGALLTIDTHPGDYHSQLFFDTGGDRLYFRNANGGSWGSWLTMWHSGNLTNLNQLTNGPGYITGINSGNVTTALGFTPYNATNPAGYTTNTGTVTSVSGTGTVSGLSLSGTVTTSGNLTLGGTLSLTSGNVTTALGFTPYNATNPNGYITSYSETDTLDSVISRGNSTTRTTQFYQTSNTRVDSVAHGDRGLTILQDTAGTDAYITFHVQGDYAGYFGLGGPENDLVWGGWSVGSVRHRIYHGGNLTNLNQLSNGPGYITSYSETDTLQSVTTRGSTTTSSITAERFRGNNSLVLNTYTTVNPSSNVFLYSQGNDRDSWIYLDSADTASNWGIYHRQIDSAVGGMEGNSIGFIGAGSSALRAYIGLTTGNGFFAGTISASNFSGSSSGTNTGDQTNISGNAATATLASTVTINYNNDSNANYQLLWGSGNSVYGTGNVYVNPSSDTIYASAYRGNANVAGTGEAIYAPAGVYSTGTNWLYGTMYLNGNTINEVSQLAMNGTNTAPISITGASSKYITINPGNGYEAMVRYIGGAGSSWYVGKRVTSQVVGTESFHFYSEAAGVTVGGINPSGDMIVTGSMRAPIFYDSANTNYFLNPNGFSNLGTVKFNSSGAGAEVIAADGVNGRLFTITDDMTDSIFSVNTISGLPVIEVFADYTVVMGRYGLNDLKIDSAGVVTIRGNTVWHAGNDGSGSGLDADLLDGQNGTYYAAASSLGSYLPLAGGTMTGTITITNTDIRSNSTSNWTGDPGAQGKIQYHAARWYIVSDSGSDRIVQFRRNGTDVSYIANDGVFHGNVSGNATTATTAGALSSMNISQFTNNSGYITGSYVVAHGTSAGDIDADWGQSFKTFDPIPSGTPPLQSPNIRTINIGENYDRRTQLAFDYNTDGAYFRRRINSVWTTWREFIHSGNIGSQTVATAGALTSMNISQFTNNSGYITSSGSISGNAATATTASSVAWSNVSSKPAAWLTTTNLIDNNEPNTAVPSGFWQSYVGAGNPTGTWFNYINVRHSNPGNGHGYQLGMSYYDNILWFRSYQGDLAPTFQSWAYAISSQNIGSQSVSFATTAGALSSMNISQFTNNSGYITGYSETDTLASVTSRGASTSTAISMTGGLTVSRDLYLNGGTGGNFGNRLIIGGTSVPYTMEDSNIRPVIYSTGAYPVLTLNHTISNGSHGPTIQFTHNTFDKQWVIGSNGIGTQLDFGYSTNTNRNPHNGIDNYLGTTFLRISNSGNMSAAVNILPWSNNAYDLGSPSFGWRNIYTNDLHLSNMNKPEGNDIDGTSGTWTIQEGNDNLYVINNLNGKKYRIKLEEI